MTKSHFVLVKLFPVNHKKGKILSYHLPRKCFTYTWNTIIVSCDTFHSSTVRRDFDWSLLVMEITRTIFWKGFAHTSGVLTLQLFGFNIILPFSFIKFHRARRTLLILIMYVDRIIFTMRSTIKYTEIETSGDIMICTISILIHGTGNIRSVGRVIRESVHLHHYEHIYRTKIMEPVVTI